MSVATLDRPTTARSCSCGARLSRYNPDAQCGACQTKSRSAAEQGGAAAPTTPAATVEAAPRRGTNRHLVAVMDRLGVSNSALGRLVKELGAGRGMVLGTDHVTVKRWREGVVPRRETVLLIAEVLTQLAGETVAPADFGMGAGPDSFDPPPAGGASGRETLGHYPNRGSVPDALWSALFERAERFVDLVLSDALFVWDAMPGLIETLALKAKTGARVRIALPDPTGLPPVEAARARLAETLFAPLATVSGARLSRHSGVANEVVRVDDELVVMGRIDGLPAAACPVLHLHRATGGPLTGSYLTGLEYVMATAVPVSAP